jgi:GTP pyrophosphokinase
MGDISTLLQNEGVNIADVSVHFNRTVADLKLVVEIRDLAQLSRVLTRIESLPNVLEAARTKPG